MRLTKKEIEIKLRKLLWRKSKNGWTNRIIPNLHRNLSLREAASIEALESSENLD